MGKKTIGNAFAKNIPYFLEFWDLTTEDGESPFSQGFREETGEPVLVRLDRLENRTVFFFVPPDAYCIEFVENISEQSAAAGVHFLQAQKAKKEKLRDLMESREAFNEETDTAPARAAREKERKAARNAG